ncbi:MAG: arylesterase, partial [Betaproteobacteria bacterium]|nr:arylesterase [Betaproteobacteria bacterium]
LEVHHPKIVVLELGGNDGLRALPISQMSANLAKMVDLSQQAGAKVLLLGMRMPPNYGPEYTQEFEAAYTQLAKRYRTALLPFLLEGFAEKQELFQPDRIHPTAEAQPLIAERVWKALAPLLSSP